MSTSSWNRRDQKGCFLMTEPREIPRSSRSRWMSAARPSSSAACSGSEVRSRAICPRVPQPGDLPEGHLVGGESGGQGVAACAGMLLPPGVYLLIDDCSAGFQGGVVVLVIGDVEDDFLHALGEVVLHQVHHLGLGK